MPAKKKVAKKVAKPVEEKVEAVEEVIEEEVIEEKAPAKKEDANFPAKVPATGQFHLISIDGKHRMYNELGQAISGIEDDVRPLSKKVARNNALLATRRVLKEDRR
jgi:hypothetical protein